MIDEGYIKFRCLWTASPPLADDLIAELVRWRRPLYAASLVGQSDGIGYGNLSIRSSPHGRFIITGTQTGHLAELTGAHVARVLDWDIRENRVTCEGPVRASSESLTHAALYELDAEINAVAHVHSDVLWRALRGQLPTTAADIAYGTPEMAEEFGRLYAETDFAAGKIAVMGGHAGGLISIGADMASAAGCLLDIAGR